MYTRECIDLSNYRLSKAEQYLRDAQRTPLIKSAFSLRTESDYEDFYVIAKTDVENQVQEAEIFCAEVRKYIEKKVGKEA